MVFYKSILLIIFAGVMNGSFVIPLRYIQHISEEKVWFYYSIMGVLIFPWILLLCFLPGAINLYAQLNMTSLLLIFLSGLIFGIAQICFADAIKKIGFSLAFSVNIGIGIVLGSMFFVFFNDLLFSRHGFMVTLSVSCVLLGLLLNYFLGKHANLYSHKKEYFFGWLLAFLAGVAGGLQNVAFVITAFQMKHFSAGLNSFWVWPLFLLAAAIPMICGFYIKSNDGVSQLQTVTNKRITYKNIFLITLMGACFTGSLWFYSLGMQNLSNNDRVIGWPILMTVIILTSQIWGLIFKEINFSSANFKAYVSRVISIAFLLVAIALLGFSS